MRPILVFLLLIWSRTVSLVRKLETVESILLKYFELGLRKLLWAVNEKSCICLRCRVFFYLSIYIVLAYGPSVYTVYWIVLYQFFQTVDTKDW